MVDRINPPHRPTADKREIKDFPKLPLATSFIRRMLGETARNERKQLK